MYDDLTLSAPKGGGGSNDIVVSYSSGVKGMQFHPTPKGGGYLAPFTPLLYFFSNLGNSQTRLLILHALHCDDGRGCGGCKKGLHWKIAFLRRGISIWSYDGGRTQITRGVQKMLPPENYHSPTVNFVPPVRRERGTKFPGVAINRGVL
jgi:hypothetical protein